MANYRKSFNFRNGVQVDEDNLIVNSNGLVGIGTSVPTEILDVRGTTKVVGLVTANHIFTPALNVSGVGTFGTVSDGKVKINSGIITAVSGVVTFYGDGRGLVNIPTSQWVNIDVGLGFTSIYAAGNVGIATSDPRFTFQVGANPNTGNGVGFNSTGSIKASGIITATTFVGSLTGNVEGNINSGISTFTTLKVGTSVNIGSGIVTATTFVGSLTGNVTGTASTASSLTGTPNITVATITATDLNSGFTTTGIGTVTNTFHVGTSGTAFSALNLGRIGVGTAIPTSEIQIRKASGSLLEVISETGSSRISIGQSVGVGRSTAVLRFGDTSKNLDIINNDTGNFNSYLHAGIAGINTGRFEWIYGQNNAQLMSLTYGGRLGLGKTNPDETLHVVGTSTVTSNAWFGNNVTVKGTLSATSFTLPSLITGTNLYVTSGISTFNNVSITNTLTTSTLGINSSSPKSYLGLDASTSQAAFDSVGVGTTSNGMKFRVDGTSVLSSVSIGNTATDDASGLSVYGGTTTLSSNSISGINSCNVAFDNTTFVGVGTTSTRSAVDFADAGKNAFGGVAAYMIVPRLTSTQIVGLSTVSGALIFNTTTSKFQGYTGVAWTDFH